MSGARLDQIVKGAPPPGTTVPAVTSRSPSPAPSHDSTDLQEQTAGPPPQPSDPLSTLPSSPPQIYLNLLILEASLRAQYLTLRARRRQHTFFLLLLGIWNACFFYALFLRPREDGSGVGGSVYWVVEMAEKVALMGGVVTGILIWGTGQWERGVRWPRRWIGVANRGLRNINAKVVIVKGPWWKEFVGHMSFLFPYSALFYSENSAHYYLDLSTAKRSQQARQHLYADDDLPREEDLSPGGDCIKLLLLPKPFSPDFRENWELYRSEYWEKENERRMQLRQGLRKQQMQTAKDQGGLLWWFRWRRRKASKLTGSKGVDIEKTHHRHYSEKDIKLAPFAGRPGIHSRTASRSSTLSNADADERPYQDRARRGSSTASTTSATERRRKVFRMKSEGSNQASHLTFNKSHSGATPPGSHSSIIRGLSNTSTLSGNDSDKSLTPDIEDSMSAISVK
ncbi:MAG: spo7 [Lasallia pustulata]|uniref:Spo7 n=1 Tax=Lasallia pustulata TaxID=136370 RepID=A0A5M8PM99_9LECA|nr:MAG: spo7 [Lasallia pustulata]